MLEQSSSAMSDTENSSITAGLTKYGLDSLPNRLPKPPQTIATPHESWKWQLRDRLGKWIEMHSEVKWLSRGKVRYGKVVDSPAAGSVLVKEHGSRLAPVKVPTSRITRTDPAEHVLKIRTRMAERMEIDPTAPAPKTKTVKPKTIGDLQEAKDALNVPKDLSRLSDREVEDLYWKTRDNRKVKTRTWMRVAMELHRRKINIDPHSGGWLPAGALASGTPAGEQAPFVLTP